MGGTAPFRKFLDPPLVSDADTTKEVVLAWAHSISRCDDSIAK